MKKNHLLSLALVAAIPAMVSAQSLTFNYVSVADLAANVGAGATGTNSSDIDTAAGVFVIASFNATTPALHYFNLADGTPGTPAFHNFTWAVGPVAGGLAGFGVGTNGGEVFLYDQSADPLGGIQKLDSLSAASATLVSNVATDPMQFSRNLAVEGSGDNTWIASVGAGDAAAAVADLFKSTDAGRTNFELQGQILGASLLGGDGTTAAPGFGKAGVGMSPPDGTNPPQYLIGSDLIGGVNRLRLFELTGTFPTDTDMGYTLHSQIDSNYTGSTDLESRSAQAGIDLGDGATEGPVVLALHQRPVGETDSLANVVMYEIQDSAMVEVARVKIPNTTVTANLGVRGSFRLDRATNTAYFAYRGAAGTQMVIGSVSYTPPPPTLKNENFHLYE